MCMAAANGANRQSQSQKPARWDHPAAPSNTGASATTTDKKHFKRFEDDPLSKLDLIPTSTGSSKR
jgi:hypothetical protein